MFPRTLRALVPVCLLLAVSLGTAPDPAPRAVANDNRAAAGRLRGGELELDLEVRLARWHPEADDGPGVDVYAFAERGHEPRIPGPVIRVPEGTRLRVRLHNPTADTLFVFGLHARPAADAPPLRLAPGELRTVSFPAGEVGTYYYWGTTTPQRGMTRRGMDSQLNGAFVVDPAGAAPASDRIFLLSIWASPPRSGVERRVVMTINGRSFPHTERLELLQDDTVQWRVINATRRSHPMHLHGFYYHVESRGDALRETRYTGEERPFIVTENMPAAGTMRMRFSPHEPGFWAFHCHIAFHSGGHLGLDPHEQFGHAAHGAHSMAGLVTAFYVRPKPGFVRAPEPEPRPLRLLVRESADTTLHGQRMAFQLHEGGPEPPAEAVRPPSSNLVLRRGERVAITVVNRLREPTQVHWHGIELESYPDGIPGISGMPGRITPPIAPGDSFTAVFTPPRAGTFIYHAHMNDGYQINLGLYGALLVLEPDSVFDPARDHVVLVGGGGRVAPHLVPGAVNGEIYHPPMRVRVGEAHRFRLIGIHPEDDLQFSITRNGLPALWRALAKDGADLPASQRTVRPAYLRTGPGETADFGFAPDAPGEYLLEVKTVGPGWYIPLRIQVDLPSRLSRAQDQHE